MVPSAWAAGPGWGDRDRGLSDVIAVLERLRPGGGPHGQENEKMSKYTEDNQDTRKGFRGQFERVPTGQIWDILNIKILIA